MKKNILLGEFLVEQGLLTESQLRQALKYHSERGVKLGRAIIDLGFMDEKDMIKSLSTQLGVQYINLKNYRIDMSVIDLVPKDLAWTYYVIPLFRLHNRLSVAMVNPLDIFALDSLTRKTHLKIEPVVAMESDILEALAQCYPEDSRKMPQHSEIIGEANDSPVTVVDQGHEQDNLILQIDELLSRLVEKEAYKAVVGPTNLKVFRHDRIEEWNLPENMDKSSFIRMLCNLGEDHSPGERGPKHFVIKKDGAQNFHLMTNTSHMADALTIFVQIPRDFKLTQNKNAAFNQLNKQELPSGITLLLSPDDILLDEAYYALLSNASKTFSSLISLETKPTFSMPETTQIISTQSTEQLASIRYAELAGCDALFCKNVRDKFALGGALALAESGASVVIAQKCASPWGSFEYFFNDHDEKMLARQLRQIYICYPSNHAKKNEFDLKRALHLPTKMSLDDDEKSELLFEAIWQPEGDDKFTKPYELFEHVASILRKKLREDISQVLSKVSA